MDTHTYQGFPGASLGPTKSAGGDAAAKTPEDRLRDQIIYEIQERNRLALDLQRTKENLNRLKATVSLIGLALVAYILFDRLW